MQTATAVPLEPIPAYVPDNEDHRDHLRRVFERTCDLTAFKVLFESLEHTFDD